MTLIKYTDITLILVRVLTDKNEVFEARQTWWDTRDAGKALECLGNRPSLERHLLLGLKKYNENDLVNALAMVCLITNWSLKVCDMSGSGFTKHSRNQCFMKIT